MKILHAIDVLEPTGGAQNYLRRLAELQVETGHEVAVIHRDLEVTAPSGVDVRHAIDSVSASAAIAEFDPDIIHVHDWGLPVESEARLVGERPFIRSFHNFSFACSTGTRYFRDGSLCSRAHGPGCLVAASIRGCAHRFDPRPVVAAYRRIESLLPHVRSTPFTLLHSEYVESIAILNGVPANRCAAIPYFVEPADHIEPIGDERTVCFSGRIVRNKGLDLLLRALARMLSEWDRLVVAGDGWDLEANRLLAERLRLTDKVDFLGWTDPVRARDMIVRSRVLAVPSRWPEPFGIVGIEAMSLQRPVVATHGGGVTEWLDDRETGLLVTPGDVDSLAEALSAVLTNKRLAEQLGEEGRRRVARFSPETHLGALDRIYATVAGSNDLATQAEVGI